MSNDTKAYELERSKENRGNIYYVFKVFNNGTRLLWARYLLRKQAIWNLQKFQKQDNVPIKILPGVFRRTRK